MKRILSVLAAAVLFAVPAFCNVQAPKGKLDQKVYDGAVALYASSHMLGVRDRFICSGQVVAKAGKEGYLVLSAGHCTPANTQELPPDMEFGVADDLGGSINPVVLLRAEMQEPLDFSLFYYQTQKKYSVVELGDENDARIGDETLNVNFSLGLAKYVSRGRVSSMVAESGEAKGFFGVDQFDSHGASGSSVVDKRTKKIIGIVIAGVDGATTASWVEPVSRIRHELDKATMPRSTRPYIMKRVCTIDLGFGEFPVPCDGMVEEPEIPATEFPSIVIDVTKPEPPAK